MEIFSSKLVNIEPPEIQKLIQEHKKLFQDFPLEIPPERDIEHIIKVK